MKENPIIKIESMSSTGSAIGHMDKLVVFVEKAVPGDLVKLRIKKKKKNYLEATMVDLLEPSPARVTPTCSHVGLCGGCKWQHIDYHEQLRYKQQQVTDNLVKLAKVPIGIIHDIVPSVKQYYYRNKLEFTFSNKRWLYKEEISSGEAIERSGLGFHLPGQFDKVLDVEKCHLQADPSNQIRTLVRKHALEKGLSFYNINTHEGFLRNLIVRTTMTGEVMVILQVGYEDSREIATILDILKENITPLTSLNYVVNSKKNDTFHDLTVHTLYGKSFISETFQRPDNKGVLHFKISPKSFFQTNSIQAEILYKIAWEFSSLTGNEIVYDLYTGTGTIANYVAGSAKKVIGIEYVPEAIADAKENSILNNIHNTAFFAGDLKDVLNDEFVEAHGKPDLIICDPPRAGMHEEVCHQLLKISPDKIVYISCNPATQARDITILASKYEMARAQPVDMFPHTPHVENIALLILKK